MMGRRSVLAGVVAALLSTLAIAQPIIRSREETERVRALPSEAVNVTVDTLPLRGAWIVAVESNRGSCRFWLASFDVSVRPRGAPHPTRTRFRREQCAS